MGDSWGAKDNLTWIIPPERGASFYSTGGLVAVVDSDTVLLVLIGGLIISLSFPFFRLSSSSSPLIFIDPLPFRIASFIVAFSLYFSRFNIIIWIPSN